MAKARRLVPLLAAALAGLCLAGCAGGPAASGRTAVGGAVGGVDIPNPNITFGQMNYWIYSGALTGNDPKQFVGDYLGQGTVNDFAGQSRYTGDIYGPDPEADTIYSVTGVSKDYLICADTSKGWQFFLRDTFLDSASGGFRAFIFDKTGLDLASRYVSASYYYYEERTADSSAHEGYADGYAYVPDPHHEPLHLSKADLTELLGFIATQPQYFASDPYPPSPEGLPGRTYNLAVQLTGGLTLTQLYFMTTATAGDFIGFGDNWVKLNAYLAGVMAAACVAPPGDKAVAPPATPVSSAWPTAVPDDIQYRGHGIYGSVGMLSDAAQVKQRLGKPLNAGYIDNISGTGMNLEIYAMIGADPGKTVIVKYGDYDYYGEYNYLYPDTVTFRGATYRADLSKAADGINDGGIDKSAAIGNAGPYPVYAIKNVDPSVAVDVVMSGSAPGISVSSGDVTFYAVKQIHRTEQASP